MVEDNASPKHYEIPPKIRTFVYLIGMLGFPVVVASYVLVVLSSDLKGVDKSLVSLSHRIDERPMGLDKTTDFVIYVTDALKYELRSKLPKLAEEIDFTSRSEKEDVIRTLNKVQRKISSYVRPIVRNHRRFSERFPSSGGNLGSYFILTAPGEIQQRGDTEAYLLAQSYKDIGESIIALMTNNMHQFGHPLVERFAQRDQEELTGNPLIDMMILGAKESIYNGEEREIDDPNSSLSEDISVPDGSMIELMEKSDFLELSTDAIETAITALRDQMLTKVRTQASDLDQNQSAKVESLIGE